MRVFYTATDGGDGSLGVSFYDSQKCIDLLEEYDLESARGDGGGYFDVVDGTITGITIENIDNVREYLVDMGLIDS